MHLTTILCFFDGIRTFAHSHVPPPPLRMGSGQTDPVCQAIRSDCRGNNHQSECPTRLRAQAHPCICFSPWLGFLRPNHPSKSSWGLPPSRGFSCWHGLSVVPLLVSTSCLYYPNCSISLTFTILSIVSINKHFAMSYMTAINLLFYFSKDQIPQLHEIGKS